MDKNINNWEMRDEGATLLHYWKQNTKLCDTIKHKIVQGLPDPNSDVDYCKTCSILIVNEFNKII